MPLVYSMRLLALSICGDLNWFSWQAAFEVIAPLDATTSDLADFSNFAAALFEMANGLVEVPPLTFVGSFVDRGV